MVKALFLLITCLILGTGGNNNSVGTISSSDGPVAVIGGADGPTAIIVGESANKGENKLNSYEIITQEKAKEIMDSTQQHIILDVREQDEFDEGHIPGALLIPLGDITQEAESALPDKDALILIYCRSGRRSKIAAEALVYLGYSNIKEFGGIIDWKYDIVK